ncbi:MAG: hypothetical protein R3B65_01930 [Candidatus Paceibacterota bacterium]
MLLIFHISLQKILNGEMRFEDYLAAKENGDFNLRQEQPVDMIERYWEFIKTSDAILVLNLEKKGIKNYIGGSTLMEMGFAYGFEKKIYLYNPIQKEVKGFTMSMKLWIWTRLF